MLVLTRKLGEEIRIGDDITVTVLLTQRNRVKLGISGGKGVPVVRAELAKPASPAVRPSPAVRHSRRVCSLEAAGVSRSQ
jgi:carbon storage regulator CsrA